MATVQTPKTDKTRQDRKTFYPD